MEDEEKQSKYSMNLELRNYKSKKYEKLKEKMV